jgi:hypothetical protein
MGAETDQFQLKQDTIELDQFASAQTGITTTDVHGDAVINLGHNDSVTLTTTTGIAAGNPGRTRFARLGDTLHTPEHSTR